MNETTMTLEELCQYAQEAKDKVEKERLAQEAKKNEVYSNIIKDIIDKLKANKGRTVKLEVFDINTVKIDREKNEVSIPIVFNEIETIIGLIPALHAERFDYTKGKTLEVTFSETEPTELPIPEEVDEIEVTELPIPEEILEIDGSEDK